jgi:FkbM family methyltransferase
MCEKKNMKSEAPKRTRVFFDVGANDGRDSIDVAHKNPDMEVYAFEPTPEMVEVIKKKPKGC